MIRLVTRARLARLAAEAEQARSRVAQARGEADAAFAAHLRTVAELTGRAEHAERDRAADADLVTVLRAELTGRELRTIVLLVRYGRPHSVHRSVHSAQAHAVAQGAASTGWRPYAGAPSIRDAWATIAFTYDDATEAFISTVNPSVPGGAGAL